MDWYHVRDYKKNPPNPEYVKGNSGKVSHSENRALGKADLVSIL